MTPTLTHLYDAVQRSWRYAVGTGTTRLRLKRRYPDNFKAYARACKADEVNIGEMFVFDRGVLSKPRFIINFPTKKHWRSPSKLDYIEAGLADLVSEIRRLEIQSIALPALGCSNGGLDWQDVKPLITTALSEVSKLRAIVYEPLTADVPKPLRPQTKMPNLTIGRALMITLIDLYQRPGYSLGRLEAQKLAYFLQAAGQDLKLNFVKHIYGPYADALNHVLQALEGHYIVGYGDRSDRSEIQVLPGVVEQAEDKLAATPEIQKRLARVKDLIEGFETPYGMELLASLHWLAAQENVQTASEALRALRQWNDRKASMFREDHIKIAWEHLDHLGWVRSTINS
ncbi:MAG: macro domain-containing protein [Trueperaceae bacterium]|nr:macro domain-containing protein [Trueperaceae bacterium]